MTVVGADARTTCTARSARTSSRSESARAGGRWCSHPNGRVEVLARVLCVGDDRFELDTEAGYGDVLAARLNRFRIRVKAEVEQLSSSCSLRPRYW